MDCVKLHVREPAEIIYLAEPSEIAKPTSIQNTASHWMALWDVSSSSPKLAEPCGTLGSGELLEKQFPYRQQ